MQPHGRRGWRIGAAVTDDDPVRTRPGQPRRQRQAQLVDEVRGIEAREQVRAAFAQELIQRVRLAQLADGAGQVHLVDAVHDHVGDLRQRLPQRVLGATGA